MVLVIGFGIEEGASEVL